MVVSSSPPPRSFDGPLCVSGTGTFYAPSHLSCPVPLGFHTRPWYVGSQHILLKTLLSRGAQFSWWESLTPSPLAFPGPGLIPRCSAPLISSPSQDSYPQTHQECSCRGPDVSASSGESSSPKHSRASLMSFKPEFRGHLLNTVSALFSAAICPPLPAQHT